MLHFKWIRARIGVEGPVDGTVSIEGSGCFYISEDVHHRILQIPISIKHGTFPRAQCPLILSRILFGE